MHLQFTYSTSTLSAFETTDSNRLDSTELSRNTLCITFSHTRYCYDIARIRLGKGNDVGLHTTKGERKKGDNRSATIPFSQSIQRVL